MEAWMALYEMSTGITEDGFEVWTKNFTEHLSVLLEQVLPVADEVEKGLLLQELNDIMGAMEARDMILLEDAVRHGLLQTAKNIVMSIGETDEYDSL